MQEFIRCYRKYSHVMPNCLQFYSPPLFCFFFRYMKYLYPYECDRKGLSTPAELQAAIDGNRREGRRTSYGQFESQMQQQLQLVRNKILKAFKM